MSGRNDTKSNGYTNDSKDDRNNTTVFDAESTYLLRNRSENLISQNKERIPKKEDINALIEEAMNLQDEINISFAELSDLNRQVRIDVEEFCKIRNMDVSNISKDDIF
ncbi:hypothetical protein TPHA_0C00600 [Tetrapisispora phaffii CBS 4417]|uniref:Biogenesis of lysosome-related organelles complex 1 subunit CNL1 n=1 Tax=Tetrapisispora phaffii (strain ATCC 24235 / CBS 4417 / NBRC 1672 / NRRL Y-8282 / UCD 70-5) TaxID=1071381 RepID=G8BR41_TETPH|nr:hypothetical protein TPHA_0C00600 [Tetrapisispora phaffii CBS 4417]CCE62217.1 hypothetical protein TPHA_0C00600 [Tetrapisispora phaffii CBS 4417]